MTLTPLMFIIVCPLLFIAGFVDAIGGGGGLISLPAYLLAGLPVHQAIATNKLSSACGTTLATLRFIKNGLVNWKLAIPTIAFAIIGSSIGANASMAMDESVMEKVLFVVLPVVAFVVLNKKLFRDNEESEIIINKKTLLIAVISSLAVGFYDGFYGPGTGTFLIIAFTVFAKLSMKSANAQAKVINLTTNLTSLSIFLMNGQVLFPLGIAAAVCNMAGGYLGAGLAMSKGSKITRPVIFIVLILLFLKILGII
ncbi:MAG: sulfite exporter TauE/SafE family protein [Clostridiales bacterium]|nr:sulfite exporter TauE/SafE family protein [Clostridiales bacterium]